MPSLDQFLGRRLAAYHWSEDGIVLTFDGYQLRLVAKMVRVSSPQVWQVGVEVRDGVTFTPLARGETGIIHGEYGETESTVIEEEHG